MSTTARLHVCLDSNIPFRYITQGQPGCEPEHLASLCDLVTLDQVTLLVPEVVLMEVEKLYRDYEKDLDLQFGKIEKQFFESVDKSKVWNEAADLVPYMKSQFGGWKTQKLNEGKVRHDEIQALLRSPQAKLLPYDEDVQFRAKRRLMAGRVPNTDGKVEADCCILESVIRYFEGLEGSHELFFCTENWKDFGVILEKDKYAIHPLMRDGLPTVALLISLATTVGLIGERKPIEEPQAFEVEQALERDKQEQIERKIEADERAGTGVAALARVPFSISAYEQLLRIARATDSLHFAGISSVKDELSSYVRLLDSVRAAKFDIGPTVSPLDTTKFASNMLKGLDTTRSATEAMKFTTAVDPTKFATSGFDPFSLKDVAQPSSVRPQTHASNPGPVASGDVEDVPPDSNRTNPKVNDAGPEKTK